MIQHGENGLARLAAQSASLAVAIEQLLRDVTFADRLGTHARGTALHKFSIEATTRTLKHLLVQRARVHVPSGARQLDPSSALHGGGAGSGGKSGSAPLQSRFSLRARLFDQLLER